LLRRVEFVLEARCGAHAFAQIRVLIPVFIGCARRSITFVGLAVQWLFFSKARHPPRSCLSRALCATVEAATALAQAGLIVSECQQGYLSMVTQGPRLHKNATPEEEMARRLFFC